MTSPQPEKVPNNHGPVSLPFSRPSCSILSSPVSLVSSQLANTLKTRLLIAYKGIPFTQSWTSLPSIAPLLSSLNVTPNNSGPFPYTLPVIAHHSAPGGFVVESTAIAVWLDANFPETKKAFPTDDSWALNQGSLKDKFLPSSSVIRIENLLIGKLSNRYSHHYHPSYQLGFGNSTHRTQPSFHSLTRRSRVLHLLSETSLQGNFTSRYRFG